MLHYVTVICSKSVVRVQKMTKLCCLPWPIDKSQDVSTCRVACSTLLLTKEEVSKT
jgi:hypothetical protein